MNLSKENNKLVLRENITMDQVIGMARKTFTKHFYGRDIY